MMTRICSNYTDNELLFIHLKSTSQAIANTAWGCLRRCAASVVKSSKWRVFSGARISDEDILHDAITKLWIAIKDGKYDDYHRRHLPFCALLRVIFKRLCIDTYDKHKNFTPVELEEIEEYRQYLPDFLDVIVQKEEIESIRKAAQTLSPNRKQAYEMYVFEGYRIEEIAQAMKIEKIRVSHLISEARKILAK